MRRISPQHRVILKRHSAEGSLRITESAPSLSFLATTNQCWLIVGLGNPGPRYAHTRHNLGARVVDALRQGLNLPAFRRETGTHARVAARPSRILAIPTTFMNTSGRAIEALLTRTRLPRSQLLVVHDDKDLPFGELRLQRNRSAAGHRGVQSIIETLGTRDFWRVRIGIGAPSSDVPTDTYVLQPFTEQEERQLTDDVIAKVLRRVGEHVRPPTSGSSSAARKNTPG